MNFETLAGYIAAEPKVSAMSLSPNLDAVLCCGLGAESPLTEAQADELASVLKALADPVRLRLVSLISQAGEACVCDLPEALGRSQPTISHHLKVLAEAGIVEREQRGRWAWFSVRTEALADLVLTIKGNE